MNKKLSRSGAKKVHALEKRKLPWGLIAGAAGCIALCGVAYVALPRVLARVNKSAALQIRSIVVSPSKMVTRDQIIAAAGIQPQMSMMQVSPGQIRHNLAGIAWIKNISINRWVPGRISITFDERVPLAMICTGHIWYIDDEGVFLSMQPVASLKIPLIFGLLSSKDSTGVEKVSASDMQRVNRFLAKIRKSDASMAQRITQMDFAREGEVALRLASCETQIKFDESNVARSTDRLSKLTKFLSNEPDSVPSCINLCHTNLAFVY